MSNIPSPDQERSKHAGNVQNHAEAYANGVLRQRTTFERHNVSEAIVSAFISGADFAGGSATQPNPQSQDQPNDNLHTAFSTDDDAKALEQLREEDPQGVEQLETEEQEHSDKPAKRGRKPKADKEVQP